MTEEKAKQRAKIGFAVVESVGFGEELAPLLLDSVRPGTSVKRYGRIWRMGQYQEDSGDVFGRIGFQTGDQRTELWSEERDDFVEQALMTGFTSPFVIDLSNLTVAFQLRPGTIELTSFTANLQALLNEASQVARWRVSPKIYRVDWLAWLDQVDVVTEISFRIKRPNPSWRDRRGLKDLVEGPNADQLDLVFKQLHGEALNLDDPIIEESLEHVADQYGSYRARGLVAAQAVGLAEFADDKGEVEYNSEDEGIALIRGVEIAAGQAEVPRRELEQQLKAVSRK
jgi:hypothetical protein